MFFSRFLRDRLTMKKFMIKLGRSFFQYPIQNDKESEKNGTIRQNTSFDLSNTTIPNRCTKSMKKEYPTYEFLE